VSPTACLTALFALLPVPKQELPLQEHVSGSTGDAQFLSRDLLWCKRPCGLTTIGVTKLYDEKVTVNNAQGPFFKFKTNLSQPNK